MLKARERQIQFSLQAVTPSPIFSSFSPFHQMRSRFLNINYFSTTSSSSSSAETLDSLSFLSLALPQLPPLRLASVLESNDRLCFGSVSLLNVSLDIEPFSVEPALSKFFSEVIPDAVDVEINELRSFGCENVDRQFSELEKTAKIHHEDKNMENEKSFGSTGLRVKYAKNDKIASEETDTHGCEMVHFETPELDIFLDGKEEVQILAKLSETENNTDLCEPWIGFKEVEEAIYSVDKINSEYFMEPGVCLLGTSSLFKNKVENCCSKFPFLEVGEMIWESSVDLSVEKELLLLFGNSEIPQIANVTIDSKEVLGAMECNLLDFLSDNFLPDPYLKSKLECPDSFTGMDFISILEASYVQENTQYPQGTTGSEYILSTDPVTFQEFQLFDIRASHPFEVLANIRRIDEMEISDHMFREDHLVKNFMELIVSPELALVDNTFTSLPIPMISDHEKINLVCISEGIFLDLKPLPLSASSGIYLDWHLLEESTCDPKLDSLFKHMFEEIDLCGVDYDLNSSDDANLLHGFYFSDDNADKLTEEDPKVPLNVSSIGIATPSEILTRVDPVGLEDGGCCRPEIEEQSYANAAERASSFFKSMSQFSDLDFFLNPQNLAAGKYIKPKEEVFVNNPPMDDSIEAKTKCEGIDMEQSIEITMEEVLHSIPEQTEKPSIQKLEEQPNFVSMVENTNMKLPDGIETSGVPLSFPCQSFVAPSGKIQRSMVSSPDTVIVVNTQNFDKEMIVCRRSTYQKIFSMEKEGVQVVERDLDLPVDVIISAMVCLVWYNCRNIGKKATELDGASSSLPLCVENVATNILTLLSYSFSSCILVFEGESRFLATIMDSSDGLYAAAASLGINLQIFCSYSSHLTDEIILRSIKYGANLLKGQYPVMAESETLAESFLTKLPSINPLSAHAILSSGRTLNEFLEWSHEQRVHAMEKYHIPDESISLFSIFCRYGEREDSRSIMTDSSSSVSSGPDSVNFHYKFDSEIKRSKLVRGSQTTGVYVDKPLQFEPVNQFSGDTSKLIKVPKPYGSWMSKDPETFQEEENPISSLNAVFGKKQGSNKIMIGNPGESKIFGSWLSEDSKAISGMGECNRSCNDRSYGCQDLGATFSKNSDWHDIVTSEDSNEGFKNKVMDFTDDCVLHNGFSCIDNDLTFLPLVSEMEKLPRKPDLVWRLSVGQSNHPTFPTATEFNLSTYTSNFVQDPALEGGTEKQLEKQMPQTHPTKPSDVCGPQKSSGSLRGSLFLEKIIPAYGQTSLSKAISSSQLPHDSPWTIQFLNRIKEKSRLRQQSLPYDAPSPNFHSSGNISKAGKRKSPSILDFFKYRGSSTPKKPVDGKRRKCSSSGSRKVGQTSASLLPSWTPTDKRARKTLSFAFDETGSQTKLVWGGEKANNMNRKFRRK